MPPAAAIAGGVGSLLGGVAGAMGSTKTSSSNQTASITPGAATGLQNSSYDLINSNLSGLSSDFGALQSSLQNGQILPNAQDTAAAQGFANDIFGAQRLQLQQGYQNDLYAANRQLAASGRDINDPIFKARMYQQQEQQMGVLNAQQGGYAANLALQMPEQRRALLSQALQNRATLLGLGSNLLTQERNWGLATATRSVSGNGTEQSGGGLQGALTGALGGASAGLGVFGAGQKLGLWGGGGGSPSPSPGTYGPAF